MTMLLSVIAVIVSVSQTGAAQCTTTSTKSDVIVSCSGLQLMSVPSSVPEDVTHLDFSHNVMKDISSFTFRRFSHIRTLNLKNNTISRVDKNAFISMHKLEELYLQNNNIGDSVSMLSGSNTTEELKSTAGICSILFPPNLRILRLDHNVLMTLAADCFRNVSQSLETLSLSYNLLETVPNDSFRDFAQLQTLDLSGNKLQRLEPYALRGLDHLHTLLLSSNSLQYDETSFPSGVFAPVKNVLTTLYLQGNDVKDGSYPESAFSDLTALTYLAVDTFPQTSFGYGFAAMHRLTTLDVSQNCRFRELTNQTFVVFENGSLQNLYASHCKSLLFVDVCAFCPLKSLSRLSLDGAYSRSLDLNVLFRAFYGFQHRNNLSYVGLGLFSFQIPTSVRLNAHTMRYVLNTCVQSINLAKNYIISIEKGAFGWPGCLFRECIQYIDISSNRFWHFDLLSMLTEMAWFPRLEFIELSNQMILDMDKAMELMVSRKETSYVPSGHFQIDIVSPPTLRFFNMSSGIAELGRLPQFVTVKNGETMKVLDMSFIRMYGCMTTIRGLSQLEIFNLSGNSCKYISDSFFDPFYMLKTLVLQKMNFDSLLFAKQGSVLFRNLSQLEVLDLSDNDLEHLPFDMLHSQPRLRELKFARNKLSGLTLDVSRYGNLTLLDMSDNAISHLNSEERVSLDRLAVKQPQPFHLRLHGNPLACTCATLKFVHWLRSTRIRLDNGGDYPCMTDSGQLSTTAAVADNWPLAWRQCVGPTALWASVLVMLLMVLSMGMVWGVAVNFTRLQFLFRVLKKIRMPLRQQFAMNAYMAYCEDDTEWVCTRLKESLQDDRGVRLLIRHLPRNQEATQWWELPGENSAQKMLEHIDLCWKVVLVLTPRLTLDPSAGFVTRAVLQSITDTMPDRVLLLCVGITRVPGLASLKALMEVVPENQVFFVPAQAGRRHPVWDRVSEVILR